MYSNEKSIIAKYIFLTNFAAMGFLSQHKVDEAVKRLTAECTQIIRLHAHVLHASDTSSTVETGVEKPAGNMIIVIEIVVTYRYY